MQESIAITLLVSTTMQHDSNGVKRKSNLADLLPHAFLKLPGCQAIFPGSSSYPAEIMTVCLLDQFLFYSDFHI